MIGETAGDEWMPFSDPETDLRIHEMALEQSPNAIIVTDAERRIEYVNRSFIELTGFSYTETIGQKAGFMASGETPPATYAELNAMLAAGKPWKGKFFNRRRDGSVHVDFAHVAPIRQADGRITHYLSIQEDVTERKRMGEELDRYRLQLEELVAERTRQLEAATQAAERSSKLLREALNSLSQGFAITDPDGRLFLCNEAHVGFFEECRDVMVPGVSAETVFRLAAQRGLLSGAIGHEEEWIRQRVERFQRANGEPFELQLADGRWLLVHEVRTPSGFMVGNRTDITEQKRIQQALTEARDAANAANQAKSQFLANMSHEIRTPMNAIIGLSHLCLQTAMTPQQRDYVAKIDSAANMLLGLINDILDFSKIEAGKLVIEQEPFCLEEELFALLNFFQPLAREKRLELRLEIAPEVPGNLLGDALRLRQILSNLLSNAIKFSEKGEIELSVTGQQSDGDQVATLRFCVKDQGIGLHQDQMQSLFRVFSQADASTTRRYGGTGLGLAISKELVTIMGGSIDVESVPGHGSSFYFCLPFRIGSAPAVESGALAGKRALLLEDDRVHRTILRRMLENLGFNVTALASGEEALATVAGLSAGDSFALILADLRLPGIDGIVTVARLRELPACRSALSIVVTGAGVDEIKSVRADDVDSYLFKPVKRSTLFDTVQTLLAGQQGLPPITAENAEASRQFAGKRILLVEDNEFNQLVGKELVEAHGATVTVAIDGWQAILAAERQPFDLVLMDMQMPVMDGVTATRILRANPRFAALPIVAMTANVLVSERERCLAAGMDDFIAKPIVPHVLFATLSRCFARSASPALAADANGRPPLALEKTIDVNFGLFYVRDQQAVYLRLLAHFAAARGDTAEHLRQAWQTGDLVGAQRLVHTVKGAAATLGAQPLAATAAMLEMALKCAADVMVVEALIDTFASRLADVLREIDNILLHPSSVGENAESDTSSR